MSHARRRRRPGLARSTMDCAFTGPRTRPPYQIPSGGSGARGRGAAPERCLRRRDATTAAHCRGGCGTGPPPPNALHPSVAPSRRTRLPQTDLTQCVAGVHAHSRCQAVGRGTAGGRSKLNPIHFRPSRALLRPPPPPPIPLRPSFFLRLAPPHPPPLRPSFSVSLSPPPSLAPLHPLVGSSGSLHHENRSHLEKSGLLLKNFFIMSRYRRGVA